MKDISGNALYSDIIYDFRGESNEKNAVLTKNVIMGTSFAAGVWYIYDSTAKEWLPCGSSPENNLQIINY